MGMIFRTRSGMAQPNATLLIAMDLFAGRPDDDGAFHLCLGHVHAGIESWHDGHATPRRTQVNRLPYRTAPCAVRCVIQSNTSSSCQRLLENRLRKERSSSGDRLFSATRCSSVMTNSRSLSAWVSISGWPLTPLYSPTHKSRTPPSP